MKKYIQKNARELLRSFNQTVYPINLLLKISHLHHCMRKKLPVIKIVPFLSYIRSIEINCNALFRGKKMQETDNQLLLSKSQDKHCKFQSSNENATSKNSI